MDESSAEQQVCVSASITFVVRKTGPILLVLVGLTGGREVGRKRDKIWVDFKSFKILENLNYSKFCLNNGGAVLL